MNEQQSFTINKKSFLTSVFIIFGLIVVAYCLTLFVPQGSFLYEDQSAREGIIPGTYQVLETQTDYPVWKIVTAPFEVFTSGYSAMVIVIMAFILLIGGSFSVMETSGLLKAVISKIALRFYHNKYMLIPVLAFIFMALGAFFGILEEIVPLVPLIVGLCYILGWDSLLGLGLSLFAACCGFSAAIMNPFTVAIAQEIAGLPLYSGSLYRIIFFVIIYVIVVVFLTAYAKRIDKDPSKSSVLEEDRQQKQAYAAELDEIKKNAQFKPSAIIFLLVAFGILLAFLFSATSLGLSDYSMPIIALLFVIMSVFSAKISGMPFKAIFKTFWQGIKTIAPSILLIPLAISVTYIIQDSMILDTIVNNTSQLFSGTGLIASILIIYGVVLLTELFVGSASAKAFLLMPLLLPLAQVTGITAQTTVLAYCMGDGFSNVLYPTNPMLLIALGLTVVPYTKWFKWTIGVQLLIVLVSVIFLAGAVLIGYQ
ncbi:MAG: AbgT family transporter [Eubacteriales bacterium]